ncbi:MAG TPA: hypothetical protein DCK95_11825 [Anaerolineaceae bacterium]|uniref:Flavinylation-associated cytochrome domain-containing protein n=1 Tax=Anaerolinea thermophila TaxID=167964 RepID=A0A101FXY9_9CHLR|nr:MAG: Uncharacterized protein XD73_0684 [Anaerolinea thermophila]HAF62995.1 hypothetical protein [Anaerolineaceae bacterium]
MNTKTSLSKNTRKRYVINFVMFFLLLAVTASSLYFLYVPAGYQGGRNPRYNMQIIFDRDTWGEIHTWTSFILSGILLVHIIFHWSWVKNVFWKYIQIWKKNVHFKNNLALINIIDDGLIAVFFLACLVSGIILFVVPGGPGTAYALIFNISRGTWKDVHVWTGIGMLVGVIVHLVIHWGWVKKVSGKMFGKPQSLATLEKGMKSIL